MRLPVQAKTYNTLCGFIEIWYLKMLELFLTFISVPSPPISFLFLNRYRTRIKSFILRIQILSKIPTVPFFFFFNRRYSQIAIINGRTIDMQSINPLTLWLNCFKVDLEFFHVTITFCLNTGTIPSMKSVRITEEETEVQGKIYMTCLNRGKVVITE